MTKRFNYTGTCIPEKHYMVDISDKLDQIMALINSGEYFTINRPRQYGKTTTMFMLNKKLSALQDYFVIRISFEGLGTAVFEYEKSFCRNFTEILTDKLTQKNISMPDSFKKRIRKINTFRDVSGIITSMVTTINKKTVLMIDEVDKSSNNQTFLNFLGMLRDKYLAAAEGEDATFQSVILAGVHDVKSLKHRVRPGEEQKFNSPWNIAVDFTVDLSFSVQEITSMLRDFSSEKNISMDVPEIAQTLFELTSGYPFLVSRLCYIIDTYVKQGDQCRSWAVDDINEAVKHILKEKNTNFESLIKNLENNPDLYQLVEDIIIEGVQVDYVEDNALIDMGKTYGIFKNAGTVQIHNRIYQERIYNYMSVNLKIQELAKRDIDSFNHQQQFIRPDNTLDFEKVLIKFQQFMKEQYCKKDEVFLERHGRLIFLAFIKPIINGQGFDFKEVQISEEKRLDVVVTFRKNKYVIELKKWYGDKAHKNGLIQLEDYLNKQGVQEGYLIIYDFRNKKEWLQKKTTG